MRRGRPSTVYVLSAPETLEPLGLAVRRHALRLRRIELLQAAPVRSGAGARRTLAGVRRASAIVTSKHAVGPLFRAWLSMARRTGRPEVWVAGPRTARSLTRLPVRVRRAGRGLGEGDLTRALEGQSPRSFVYFRSDRAGPNLARTLRARGHRVTSLIAYRVHAVPEAVRPWARELPTAGALVVTSPSALSALANGIGRSALRALGRSVPTVTLGPRTAAVVRAAGFRRVVVCPSTNPQRLARCLVRAVRDAAG